MRSGGTAWGRYFEQRAMAASWLAWGSACGVPGGFCCARCTCTRTSDCMPRGRPFQPVAPPPLLPHEVSSTSGVHYPHTGVHRVVPTGNTFLSPLPSSVFTSPVFPTRLPYPQGITGEASSNTFTAAAGVYLR